MRTRPPGDPLAAQNLVVVFEGLADRDGARACRERFLPPDRELTEQEIAEVYARWVGEYNCLLGLGYRPVPPPPVDTFLADWRTGPWMPIDGVDFSSWSDAQYQQAKERCTLEMYDR